MNKNPKISVLLPMYNAEAHIQEAVDSILNQSYQNFELIIINDGSTDQSLQKVTTLYGNNKKVRLIDQKNHGLIFTLNKAIALSEGELLARMDADDISFPDRFLKQVQLFESTPDLGICGSSTKNFGFNNDISIKSSNDDELKAQLLISPPFAHPSVMIKKSVLTDNNILYDEEYKHCEDFAFWSDLAQHCIFSNVTDISLMYRVHENQITNTFSDTVMEAHYKLCSKNLAKINIHLLKEDFLPYIGHAPPPKGMPYLLDFYFSMLKNNEITKTYNQQSLQKMIEKLLTTQVENFSGVKGLISIYLHNKKLLPPIKAKLVITAVRRGLIKTARTIFK